MKPLLLILLYFVSVDVNYSDSYQKDAWKCLDNSYKTLLTDPKQSAAYSMQAYDILKQTTDSALIVYTLSMSGHAYMLYGNFDLSMNVYYKALSYCPEKDLKAKAKINLNLGTLYGSLKDFSKAMELIDNATSTYKVLNDSAGIANAYNARGLIHVYMNETNIADKFFKDALRINKVLGDKKNMAANINNLCLYEGNTEEKIMLLINGKMDQNSYDECQSTQLSKELKLSRNQVIRLLNELFNEKKLIKIKASPILYLSRASLESKYKKKLSSDEYKSLDELEAELNNQTELKNFEKLIGSNESMYQIVEKIKATVAYPPVGLPMLLYGPTGTGKSFMAKLTYEYCVDTGLIDASKNFVQVNCSEYANNPELLTANLFGYKKGAFTGADSVYYILQMVVYYS